MSKLSSSELLHSAISKTDLSDFGGGEVFGHDFERFVSALDLAQVPDDRRRECRDYIVHLLMNRLFFEHDVARNPEIEAEAMLPPVAIAAMPRAGTSKLQRILGTTRQLQNLKYWHTHSFARIPGEPDGGERSRRAKAAEFLAWLTRAVPNIMQTHPMAVDEVEEEYLLMEASFRSTNLSMIFPVPEYAAWLGGVDSAPTYDYLARQLRYVQWQFRKQGESVKRWLLKSPGMLGHEDQLTRVFPNGLQIISTHRTPEELMPSSAVTAAHFFRVFGEGLDPCVIGSHLLAWFSSSMQRYMEWRNRNPSAQILDLGFEEISRNSVGTARKVCDFLGMPLTCEAIESIRRWDAENPRSKHGGKLDATLEEYGLDRAQVRRAFAPYMAEFGRYF